MSEAPEADTSPAGPSPALRSSAACSLSGVRSVEVPFERTAGAKRIELRYRVFPSRRSGAPTVVVVPGGPGSHIMHRSPEDAFALGAVPSDAFNVIYADARGSGCNDYEGLDLPATGYTIETVARDILAVVEAEHLTDYFVYGASFGTTAATVAASLAEREGVPAPRRLVLEGTVGRAFDGFGAYFAEFGREWLRVKPMLDAAWRNELDKEPWSPTLLWTRRQWGAFIAAQLILGDIPGEGHMLNHWLRGLSRRDPGAQQYVSTFMAAVTDAPPGKLFRTIACRELWGSWHVRREILGGGLVAAGPDICGGTRTEAPYDSAIFQSTVPITYFHGPYDPTTTTAQAEYHLSSHTVARRQFVTVPNASHAPLTLGLAGRACARAMWEQLAADPDRLGDALATCAKPGEPQIELRELDAE